MDAKHKERKTRRTVHISDVHLDWEYKPSTIANCNEIMCCRESAGYPTKDDDIAAGEWGMPSRCDMPPKTYQSALDFIVDEIKPDLIIFGGDNSAHDIYKNTSEEVTKYTIQVSDML